MCAESGTGAGENLWREQELTRLVPERFAGTA